jgi:hypothetical protein
MARVVISLFLLFCVGCTQDGFIVTETVRTTTFAFLPPVAPATQPASVPIKVEEKTRTTVHQPRGADVPATVVTATSNAGMRTNISTGAVPSIDQALTQLQYLPYIGIGICVLGLGLLAVKKWIPDFPLIVVVLAEGLGMGLIAAPTLIDRYVWVMVAWGSLLLLLGVIALVYYAYRNNWFNRETGPTKQRRLAAKGQKTAAGALAWLHSGGDDEVAKSVSS